MQVYCPGKVKAHAGSICWTFPPILLNWCFYMVISSLIWNLKGFYLILKVWVLKCEYRLSTYWIYSPHNWGGSVGSGVSWDKTISPYFLSILCRMKAIQSGCLVSASRPTAAIPLLFPVAGTSWSRWAWSQGVRPLPTRMCSHCLPVGHNQLRMLNWPTCPLTDHFPPDTFSVQAFSFWYLV